MQEDRKPLWDLYKYIIVGLAMVGALSVPVAEWLSSSSVPEELIYSTCEDARVGVRFDYPSGWKRSGMKDLDRSFTVVYVAGDKKTAIAVGFELTSMTSSEQYCNVELEALREDGIRDIKKMNTTLDGRPARQLVYDGGSFRFKEVICVKGDRAYAFRCRAPRSKFDGYKRFFDEMIDSLEFLD
jgi:predicted Zn-dependent protease